MAGADDCIIGAADMPCIGVADCIKGAADNPCGGRKSGAVCGGKPELAGVATGVTAFGAAAVVAFAADFVDPASCLILDRAELAGVVVAVGAPSADAIERGAANPAASAAVVALVVLAAVPGRALPTGLFKILSIKSSLAASVAALAAPALATVPEPAGLASGSGSGLNCLIRFFLMSLAASPSLSFLTFQAMLAIPAC